MTRPRLRRTDGLFWVGPGSDLGRLEAVPHRDPDTVLRWQRRRFREYWIATANPPRGALRIHGELLGFGIDAAQRITFRLIPHGGNRLKPGGFNLACRSAREGAGGASRRCSRRR